MGQHRNETYSEVAKVEFIQLMAQSDLSMQNQDFPELSASSVVCVLTKYQGFPCAAQAAASGC